ncbi:MAG TPA: AI-2E family transporter [Gemmatimonadales bacterium]|nr:AI-2E family transporter [Gemmatimonadales bacterium]
MASIDSNHTRAAILILALGLALAIALTPFATGLIGVPVLYVLLQPAHDWLARHVRPTPAAVIVVALAVFLVLVPGVSFVSLVVGQAQQVVSSGVSSPLIAGLAHVKIGDTDLGPQLASLAQEVARWIGSKAFSLVGTAARLAINVLIALFGLYYSFLQPGKTWAALQPYIPFSAANAERLRQRFRNVTISTVIGTGATAVLSGIMVGIAFWLAGLGNATFWGVVATVLAVLPILGTGLVWIPAAIALYLGNRPVAAILMAVWGLVIVGNVGYVIQPMVYRKYANIHPLITLLGALAGVPWFGILGLLIGPLALSYFFELLKMYREEYLTASKQTAR